MKLLFDANLSPKLVNWLAELYVGSKHVFDTGLEPSAPDLVIWEYARQHDFIIVTADWDFVALSRSRGAPPQVIRLDRCNVRSRVIENLLRRQAIRIGEFSRSGEPLLQLKQEGS